MSDQLLFWSDIFAGQVHLLSHALTCTHVHVYTLNSTAERGRVKAKEITYI